MTNTPDMIGAATAADHFADSPRLDVKTDPFGAAALFGYGNDTWHGGIAGVLAANRYGEQGRRLPDGFVFLRSTAFELADRDELIARAALDEFNDDDWRDNPTYNDEPLADSDLFAESPGRWSSSR